MRQSIIKKNKMLDKTGQRSIAKRLKTGGKGNEEFL